MDAYEAKRLRELVLENGRLKRTTANETHPDHRVRRFYSPQFKTQVTQACRRSGASVRGVALTRGMNPASCTAAANRRPNRMKVLAAKYAPH